MGPGRTARGTRRIVTTGLCIVTALTMALTTQAAAEPVPEPTDTPTATLPVVTVVAQTAGTKVVGAPSNVWGTATGAPNAPVSVQALVNGAWSTSGTGTTDNNGFYVLPLTYGVSTPGSYTFRVVVTVDDTHYISPTVTLIRTAPAVTVTATTAGTKVVGATTNVWGTATGAPNAPVSVQALVNGAWSTSRTGTTDNNGFYVLPLTYGVSTAGSYTFRVVVTVDDTHYISPTVTLIRTAPAVTVTATTAGTKVVGATTNVWGTATGAPNAPVSVQALVNGAWSTSRTGTTDNNGFYVLPLTYGASTAGSYTFRVVVTVDDTHYISPTVTLRRTRLDPRCFASGVVICASKSDRKVYYVKAGQILKTLDARFGGLAYDAFGNVRTYTTREGSFTVTRKVRNEVSYAYGNVPMPFSLYFYGAQAFHYSYGFASQGWVGSWGSHGCINLRDWSGAEWIFNNSSVGTRVVVYR